MTALLNLSDVTCARGGVALLSGLSVEVEPGDIVWLQGANGSGKSTLLRTMAGLMPPASGDVSHARPPQESVTFLGHRNGFDPLARVRTSTLFWLSEPARKGLDTLLDTMLTRSRRMSELSAGQSRKLELRRLLGQRRPLWLLDEPYASLDTDSAQRLTEEIVRHASEGGACVVASHAGLPAFGREVRTLRIGRLA